jgi:hypothetical protein
VLAFVASSPVAITTPAIPALTSAGLTWVQVESALTGSQNSRRITLFRALTETAIPADTIDITFGGQNQDHCLWSVFEYSGVDPSGVSGQGAIIRSGTFGGTQAVNSISELFNAAGDPDGAVIAGGVLLALVNEQPRAVTPGNGCTEIHEQGGVPAGGFGPAATMQTEEQTDSDSPVSWSWTGAARPAAAILAVLKPKVATGPGPGPGTGTTDTEVRNLIKRFEPILFFDPAESYFPVDAKRHVEASALWRAAQPFDDKTKWGTPGAAPAPMVVAGQLAAEKGPGISGLYIDDPTLRPSGPTDERWLELGGWKNPDEVPEPSVTGGTTNRYANRAAILNTYPPDQALNKCWYHAEFFDNQRLVDLANRVPDFASAKVVAGLGSPSMLCYYFFFPAHEQSVGTDQCPNVEAKEAACRAGDWQCYAILLEGSGPAANFTPRLFATTGLFANGDLGIQYDTEFRTRIIAAQWDPTGDPASPDVVDEHAKLYVARGSHSLSTTPGVRTVDPFVDKSYAPTQCGRVDGPFVDWNDTIEDDNNETAVLIIAKVWLSTILTGTPIPGAASMIDEVANHETSEPPPPPPTDPPNPETSASTGSVVKPSDVTLSDVPADKQHSWAVKQEQVGPLHYDYVVDRTTQGIWPSDDGLSGYRGRWGQRVTSDVTSRRCGPLFPAYWDLFVRAIEAGKVDGKSGF